MRKGFSVGNLKNIRQFYKVYSTDQIGETVFSQLKDLPSVNTSKYQLYLPDKKLLQDKLGEWVKECDADKRTK